MSTRRMAVSILVLCVFSCATTLSQQKPAASAPSGTLEFPVVMQQNVAAGKTPVGAKIRAKLEVATLIDGKVVPRNAVFSGEVIESVAKTPTDPSRLAIRINSVLWKKESRVRHRLPDGVVLPHDRQYRARSAVRAGTTCEEDLERSGAVS